MMISPPIWTRQMIHFRFFISVNYEPQKPQTRVVIGEIIVTIMTAPVIVTAFYVLILRQVSLDFQILKVIRVSLGSGGI